MAVYTGSHPKEQRPGVKSFFDDNLKEHAMEWKELFKQFSSDKGYEEFVQRVGHPLAAVKGQGAAIDYQDSAQGYISKIDNVVYAQGAIITREAVEDNQYGKVAQRSAGYIGKSIRQTLENVAANIFNRITTAGYTGGDGVVLASASHPEHSGNQSNLLSPAADFSETALEDMIIQIGQAKDPAGLTARLTPHKLIGPIQLQFEFCRVLKSMLQNDTANNAINAVKSMGMLPGGYHNNHYFTDTDAWGILTDEDEGMICLNRRGTEFNYGNDFDTQNLKIEGSVRKGFGWGTWRGVYWSEGV